jgi:hypothetical protein
MEKEVQEVLEKEFLIRTPLITPELAQLLKARLVVMSGTRRSTYGKAIAEQRKDKLCES